MSELASISSVVWWLLADNSWSFYDSFCSWLIPSATVLYSVIEG